VRHVEQTGHNRFLLTSDRDVRPEAAAAAVTAGGRLFRLSVDEPSLEAIYTHYFDKMAPQGDQHAA
jgi:ABC-2 type transport system ATP-binding protein